MATTEATEFSFRRSSWSGNVPGNSERGTLENDQEWESTWFLSPWKWAIMIQNEHGLSDSLSCFFLSTCANSGCWNSAGHQHQQTPQVWRHELWAQTWKILENCHYSITLKPLRHPTIMKLKRMNHWTVYKEHQGTLLCFQKRIGVSCMFPSSNFSEWAALVLRPLLHKELSILPKAM